MSSISPKDEAVGRGEQNGRREDDATEATRMKPGDLEVSDFKSQALVRLIEANRLLKNALESLIPLVSA